MPAPDDANHAAYVEGWWKERAKKRPPEQLIPLFEQAMGALWRRAHMILGEVTLAAILDRVLYVASERYSFLSSLKVDEGGMRTDEFSRQQASHHQLLHDAFLFVLVEFLTVLGHLTDEILTPALYAELSKVRLKGSKRAGGNLKKTVKKKGVRS